MKGKVLAAVSVLTCCLLWSPFSQADSLTIRFSSGKTQQVTLEESANNIMNIQTHATGTSGDKAAQNVLSREIDSNASDAPADKKKSYRLKWGAPKFGE